MQGPFFLNVRILPSIGCVSLSLTTPIVLGPIRQINKANVRGVWRPRNRNKKIRNRGDHQDLIGGRRLLVLKEDVDHIRGGYSLH